MSNKTFEQQLYEDLPSVIRCLMAEPKTDEEHLAYSSAYMGWESKYGYELLSDVEDILGDLARHLIENCGYEDFNHD